MQNCLAPGLTSARTEVLARFVTFFRGLRFAPSHEVRTAALLSARDLRSVTGRNISLVAQMSGLDPWTANTNTVREALREREQVRTAERDIWRVDYLKKLVTQRQTLHYNAMKEEAEAIKLLIDSLCKG